MAADVVNSIKKGNGTTVFTTVSGGKLSAMLNGKSVALKDENCGTATMTVANLDQKMELFM